MVTSWWKYYHISRIRWNRRNFILPNWSSISIHLSLFSKEENTNEYGHYKTKKLEEKTIPQGYLRCPSSQFSLDTKRSAATHQWCYWQHSEGREERDRLFQWPYVETASTASSPDAPPPSIAPQWTQSLKKGPKSQRRLMQLFEGIALTVSHRKTGNLQGFSCSNCQGTLCSTQPMCGSLQKEKQVMPRYPPRSKCSQNCQLTVCITIISVSYGYCYSQLPSLPRPDENPSCRAVSRKLHTKLPVCPNPVNNTCQTPRQHPVQQNGLKQEQNKNPNWKQLVHMDSGDNTELTKASSRDQATVTLIWLAVSTNRSHSFSTSWKLPPNCRASMRHETFANNGSCGSTFPGASGIRSSRKGYSRSRTTRGASIILSRCLSSSSSGSGFPSKSNTRQPGVSRRSRWSREKWRCPWKCRMIPLLKSTSPDLCAHDN